MTQSPLSPTLPPITEFVQHYIDSLENLPLDIQRHVTRLREYDILYRNIMEQVGRYLVLYRNANSGPGKKKFLTKIQKCLIKSQQYGDDKLNIISQIVEMIESRTQQLTRDAERLDMENTEENNRTSSQIITNYRMKMEKGVKITEKPQKNIYEKPKRQPRRARVTEKIPEKIEKNNSTVQRYMDKEELEEEEIEDDEIEEDEETEVKVKKELKRKPEKVKEKEKEKEKVKEEKEERKEERKSTGKVTKKAATPKQVSTKIKKKRKKEKESTIEDVPVDPDEPTYCICNSISYGDMIGCDNDDCEIEWFHFGCVNLTHKPKGKWYCPRCSAERKEKGKK